MSVLRIPLSWPYSERGSTTAKDSRRVNVMDEVSGQTTYTIKRPGFDLVTNATFPGSGQGLTQFNDNTYYITNDILQTISSLSNSGTDGSAWTSLGAAPWGVRWGHQCLLLNNTIYLIGGVVNGETIPASDVWALGIDSDWKQCTGAAEWGALTEGRYYFSSCVLNGRMFVMGGKGSTGTFFNDQPDIRLLHRQRWSQKWAREHFACAEFEEFSVGDGCTNRSSRAIQDNIHLVSDACPKPAMLLVREFAWGRWVRAVDPPSNDSPPIDRGGYILASHDCLAN